MYLPAEREVKKAGTKAFVLRIRGLKGGHSGADIHLQRASANVLLGRILFGLKEKLEYDLGAATRRRCKMVQPLSKILWQLLRSLNRVTT